MGNHFCKQDSGYTEELDNQLSSNHGDTEFHPELIDLFTARMKSIEAKWLIEQYKHLCVNSVHRVVGFIMSNILRSVDTGKPVLINVAICQAEDSDDTEDDSESGESDTDITEDEIVVSVMIN